MQNVSARVGRAFKRGGFVKGAFQILMLAAPGCLVIEPPPALKQQVETTAGGANANGNAGLGNTAGVDNGGAPSSAGAGLTNSAGAGGSGDVSSGTGGGSNSSNAGSTSGGAGHGAGAGGTSSGGTSGAGAPGAGAASAGGSSQCAASCNKPSACVTGDFSTLTTYPGTCASGSCTYQSMVTRCPFGCVNGAAACKPDPCLALNCAAGCVNGACLTATAVATGSVHTCALLSDGTMSCWGDNSNGELGNGTATMAGISTPAAVIGLTGASTAITAGGFTSCTLLKNGSAQCWGSNVFGITGTGTEPANIPKLTSPEGVRFLNTPTSIVMGFSHACAIYVDTSAVCWGDNTFGQLGDSTMMQRIDPAVVSGLTGVTSISPGDAEQSSGSFTCALLSNGTVSCWGDNQYGQLGDGTITSSASPVNVKSLTESVSKISAGDQFTCVATVSGKVYCWGNNVYGELGIDLVTLDPPQGITTPTQAAIGVAGAVGIACGDRHACALLGDGTIKCWGSNVYGQLGDGTKTNSASPVSVVW